MSTPALVECEPDTAMPLPHMTWHDDWRPLLAEFAAAAPQPQMLFGYVPPRRRLRVMLNRLRDSQAWSATWDIDATLVRRDLHEPMMEFARALYGFELPAGGAVALTRIFDGPGADTCLSLLAWLRGAVCELAGDETAAVTPPTGGSGHPDGMLELHCDCWIPELLFNVFNDTIPLQGEPLLIRVDEMWEIAAKAGAPADVLSAMGTALDEGAAADFFDFFTDRLYQGPWAQDVEFALYERAMRAEMGPGQGYLINDREWLHGRTVLVKALLGARVEHRLYRFVFNTERLQAKAVADREGWEARGYVPAAVPVAEGLGLGVARQGQRWR